MNFSALVAAGLVAASAATAPRQPIAADRFYPADPKELAAWIERLWRAAPKAGGSRPAALLVPHAAIEYSGAASARAFKTLSPGTIDAVVVIGTAHGADVDGAALYPGSYGVPGAALPYDATLARELMAATPLIRANPDAHAQEHSIEVQVPFIRRALGSPALVGLLMSGSDLEQARVVGRALAAAARGRRVLLVASSDLSHYPAGELADSVDRATLEALTSLEPARLWLTNRLLLNRGLPDLALTFCGESAVLAVLEAAKTLGAGRVEVLERLHSGQVVEERDFAHVVGYGAVALRPGKRRPPAPLSPEERAELIFLARAGFKQGGRRGAGPALAKAPRLNLPGAVRASVRLPDGSSRGPRGWARIETSLGESAWHHARELGFEEVPEGARLVLEIQADPGLFSAEVISE